MHNGNVPIIKPRNITEYEYKQSKYPHVPQIPFRNIIVASSTGGKTVLIQNLILDVYRDCFSRVFIFSPSVHTRTLLLLKLKNMLKTKCTWMTKKNKYILNTTIQKS